MTTIFRAAPKLHSPAKYASNILYHTSLRPITWRGMVRLRKNVYFIMNNNNNNNTKRKKKKKKKENLSLSTTEVRSTVCRAGVSETLIGQVKMRNQSRARFSNLLLTLLAPTGCHASLNATDWRHYEIVATSQIIRFIRCIWIFYHLSCEFIDQREAKTRLNLTEPP